MENKILSLSFWNRLLYPISQDVTATLRGVMVTTYIGFDKSSCTEFNYIPDKQKLDAEKTAQKNNAKNKRLVMYGQ